MPGASLWPNPPKRAVMIVGIVELVVAAGDDAARSAITPPGTLHRIFAVIAAWSKRQALFEIAENDAVTVVGERAAVLDQRQGLPGFSRWIGGCDPVDGCVVAGKPERA